MGSRMVDTLWSLIVWMFNNMPWLVMALVAALALSKRKKSLPLILQVLGAAGMFLVAVLRWLIFWLLNLSHPSIDIYRAASIIFSFLWIVVLLVFVAGYCWEKIVQWREPPAAASAFPVQ